MNKMMHFTEEEKIELGLSQKENTKGVRESFRSFLMGDD
jgi:hypothetical protein